MFSVMNRIPTACFIAVFHFAALLLPGFAFPSFADGTPPVGISTDGSLGAKTNLPGPDYQIPADLGMQKGQNLFHSFEQFNVHSGESAMFTGPGSVHNIISRVTGSNASWINGRLGSAIPQANLFFLNPAGVVFGPNATLDLSGSFHVSTADYLRMGEEEQFSSMPSENEILSVGAPSAFGFIDDAPAAIRFKGGETAMPAENAGLHVSRGESITITGGDIEMRGITHKGAKTDENGTPVTLGASGGQIGMAAAASAGEIALTPSGMASDMEKLGNIHLSENVIIDAGGEQGGRILIRSGRFMAENSRIQSNAQDGGDGGEIRIEAQDAAALNGSRIQMDAAGDAAKLSIAAKDISFADGSGINSYTAETGQGGNILLSAENTLSFSSSAVTTKTDGAAGDLSITAKDISFTDGAYISTISPESGPNEEMRIKAENTVSFTGSYIRQVTAGTAGKLSMEAKTISFSDGAYIDTGGWGNGEGGDIQIKASDSVSFSGKKADTPGNGYDGSFLSTKSAGMGDSGSVSMEAGSVSFTDYAYIDSGSKGTGDAGDIRIQAKKSVRFASGVITSSMDSAQGLQINGYSGLDAASESRNDNAGNAGSVRIEAENMSFENGAFIRSGTDGTGNGGTITLKAQDVVRFTGDPELSEDDPAADQIRRHSGISISSGYDKQDAGDAGSLDIEANDIFFKNGAYIDSSTAGTGKGGDIRLQADHSLLFTGEDSTGAGSGIGAGAKYRKTGAGDAGRIEMAAPEIRFADGAHLDAGSYGAGNGGKIIINGAEKVVMQGKGENGPPVMYAGSKSTALTAGSGGSIDISARDLSMSDHASISVSADGNGAAGNIALKVSRIALDSGASIQSGSGAVNLRFFDDTAHRDKSALVSGDIVEVTGEGTYIFTGSLTGGLETFTPLYRAGTLEELQQSGIIFKQGDVAEIADGGDGKPARYICIYDKEWMPSFQFPVWIRFDPDQVHTFPDMGEIDRLINNDFAMKPDLPAYTNSVIRILDAGDGKEAFFVCTAHIIGMLPYEAYWLNPVRLGRFEVPDPAALTELADHHSMKNGDVAAVAADGSGVPSEFAFFNGEFIKIKDTVHTIDEKDGIFDLIQVQTGTAAKLSDMGDGKKGACIYSGKEWIPLTGVYETVSNRAELDCLPLRSGDVAYVSDTGQGHPGYFVFDGSEWAAFAGGDAGCIHIEADRLTLSGGSRISSSTQGSGDSANINMEVKRLTVDSGATVSSSSDSGLFGGRTGSITIAGKMETNGKGDVTATPEPAESVTLTNGGSLTTEAKDAAGGEIIIRAEDRLYLDKGGITSKVYGGDGKGGDIRISHPEFVIMNQGKIIADAHEGDGGNIHVAAAHFVESSDSVMSASSTMAKDGDIHIESPDTNVGAGLAALPSDTIDASRWIKTPCSERRADDAGSFILSRRDGIPPGFDDYLPVGGFRMPDTGEKGRPADEKGDPGKRIRLLEKKKRTIPIAALLARSYMAVGHYRKAAGVLNAALPLLEKTAEPGSHVHRALFFNTLTDLKLILGDRKGAISSAWKGLEAARRSDDLRITAGSLNGLGNLQAAGGDYRSAGQSYGEALALVGKSDNGASLKSRILLNRIRAEFGAGKYENAIRSIEYAAECIHKQPDAWGKAADLISLSLLARKMRNHPKLKKGPDPEEWLKQAAHIGEKTGNSKITACALGSLGEYYEDRKAFQDALAMTRKALFFAHRGYYPEILYRLQWQLGRLFRQKNNIGKAVASYRDAIATLNPIRTEFFTGRREQRKTFEKDIKPVYTELARLFMEKAEGAAKEERTGILARAAAAMEMGKKAELQDLYRDECLVIRRSAGTDRQIPPQTAVMYPIPLPDHLSLLLMFPGGMKQIRVPVTPERLRQTAKRLRRQLESCEDEYKKDAMRLYDWLIRPARSALAARNTETLIIVPDGALSLIPFAALHSGKQFLVEEYALGTVPSLSLTDIRQRDRENSRIMLGGLSDAREGFSPLEKVEAELESIGSIMENTMETTVLLNRNFTVKNLEKECRNQDFDIVHLATHAVFADTPRDTFLLTYDGRLTLDGLERLVGLKKYREKQIGLLTLSACETAVGDERAAFGLAGVAIRAGAGSALATCWKVEDHATSELLGEFYRQSVTPGVSKAKALQKAQKAFIVGSKYNHPVFWAAFLLIGNWM